MSWTTAWENALDSADDNWGSIDLYDGFTLTRTTPNKAWNGCGGALVNVVRRYPIAGSAVGTTRMCGDSGTRTMEEFHMTIDTNENWYAGAGSDYNALEEMHLRGVATHEFGHAAGFGVGTNGSLEWDTGPAADTSLCVLSDLSNYHTMCSTVPYAIGPSSVEDESWRWTSLESHDTVTFENAYP